MYHRKTTPKVKNGIVQRKNRFKYTARQGYVLDRERPLPGYQHVVSKNDILKYITIIPDWDFLSNRIERILLSSGDRKHQGLYETFHREGTGLIELSAWKNELWFDLEKSYFIEHEQIYKLIELSYEEKKKVFHVRFTKEKARAYMLLHVFLHELGHHHDRMTTKNKKRLKRGEEYAEQYANNISINIFNDYIALFGKP